MVKIMSAVCEVCGKVFEGENCVAEAEEHEKITVGKPIYKIGDTLIYPKVSGYVNIDIINDIHPAKDDHKIMYNGFYCSKNVFKLPIIETKGVRIICKRDILNSPTWSDLRERFLELYVNEMLNNIERNKQYYGIDKIIGHNTGD